MKQLTEPDRDILMMRNLEMLSNQETAHVLAIAPWAASQRLRPRLVALAATLDRKQPAGVRAMTVSWSSCA
jgi:DNA-directed RNA polymerase specialized sigma24 family protein